MSHQPWIVKRWARVVVLTVLAGSLLCPAPALQAALDPMSQIKETVDKILAVLKDEKLAAPEMRAARRAKVEELVDAEFDFQVMGKKILSDTWDTMSPEEKKEFVDLLARMVKQRYIGKIDSYSGQKVVFKKQLQQGKRARVFSVLRDNNTEIPIDYMMVLDGDRWMVYDLKIENVGQMVTYRSEFARSIKTDGVTGLLKKMRERVDRFETEK